jgi:hypothetical protein
MNAEQEAELLERLSSIEGTLNELFNKVEIQETNVVLGEILTELRSGGLLTAILGRLRELPSA